MENQKKTMMKSEIQPLFFSLGKDEEEILSNFDLIVQDVTPLSAKQKFSLPFNINKLSHQLTDERTTRQAGYMNDNVMISSYVHYFMWWNLFRLTHLFASLPQESFSFLQDDDYCLDLGSGPLTVITALYLARPELRSKKLVWYCIDLSQNAMKIGEEIFLSVCARLSKGESDAWKIIRVQGKLGVTLKNKAKFITCANMFNELYYDNAMPLEQAAKKYTAELFRYKTQDGACIFVAEPAFPRSSRFVSLTRDAFIRENFTILLPCPHEKTCPMDGSRQKKWCHFVLNADSAPKKLQALSKDAKLAKERASLSFVLAKENSKSYQNIENNDFSNATKLSSEKNADYQNKNQSDKILLRVASDEILLPGDRKGRYCCSELGLTLLTGVEKLNSGDLVTVEKRLAQKKNQQIDRKTGAIVIDFHH